MSSASRLSASVCLKIRWSCNHKKTFVGSLSREVAMQFPSLNLENKVALVTGAGSGLGQAIAIGFAQAGADVAITELPGKAQAAAETKQQIENAGRRAFISELDVTKMEMIHQTVDAVL